MKIFTLLLAFVSFSTLAGRWSPGSDPRIMSATETNFHKLPLSADISAGDYLWAADYWPHRKGLINRRWNTPNQPGFDLVSPTKEQVKTMTIEELATLAPSEKFDLLNGNYHYPLKAEVSGRASYKDPLWWGVCNGWSPASINHREPLPKILTNPDGINIPFGSSDIKAMLSYYYAYHHKVSTTNQMGRRCMTGVGPGCSNDLNPGAFHIVLTNKLGLEKTSFVADVEGGRQVWNHAVTKYVSTIVNDNMSAGVTSARGTVRRIQVKTVMTFVLKIKENSWYPTNGTEDHVDEVRNYEYTLELDAQGKIIGGEWISKARPDFLWNMETAQSFNHPYSRISELLND